MAKRAAALLFAMPLVIPVMAEAARADQSSTCADANSQSAMNHCTDAAWRQSDVALNKNYAAVLSRLRPEGKGRLRTAQRAWIEFRDKECSFESGGADGGSVAPMIAANCAIRLTDERAKALSSFRRCEEGDLSCPH